MHRRLTAPLRLNRTLDESTGEYGDDEGTAAVEDDGVMAVDQVQDICAYSRHQGLGHKISGRPVGHGNNLMRLSQ